jgi:hypothetical protein
MQNNATLPPSRATCNVQLVNVHYNARNELCATLTDEHIAVECEDVLFLDFVDEAAKFATYMEWRQRALMGEAGYTITTAAT